MMVASCDNRDSRGFSQKYPPPQNAARFARRNKLFSSKTIRSFQNPGFGEIGLHKLAPETIFRFRQFLGPLGSGPFEKKIEIVFPDSLYSAARDRRRTWALWSWALWSWARWSWAPACTTHPPPSSSGAGPGSGQGAVRRAAGKALQRRAPCGPPSKGLPNSLCRGRARVWQHEAISTADASTASFPLRRSLP